MNTLLEMQDISKSFPGVKVLDRVQFSLYPGEVHALMGENGAGKSTLMKILGGIYHKDSGSIRIKGQACDIPTPGKASQKGVAIIHQELNLVPHLTVMENIFLGREFTHGKTPFVSWGRMAQEAEKYLTQLGMDIDPRTLTETLSVGQQQMVEIAKALSMQAEILVLDEPTAALTEREIEALFQVIDLLRQQGVGMVYISHRMEEIFRVANRITVLRDGMYVGTKQSKETNMDELVRMMVGREITERFPKVQVTPGQEVLSVKGLNQKHKLKDVSFTLRSGEILGIAGLMGAGRTELVKALFGAEPIDSGEICLEGQQLKIRKPSDAIQAGIVLVTEDRKKEGLALGLSVKDNISLPNLKSLTKYGLLSAQQEQELADGTIKKLGIKTASADKLAGSLSGGNQQKIVIGKWLVNQPKVLMLDEPTRGVDIGAKKEIYELMNQLVQQGVAIIMVSSELPEVMGMSDRILVMFEGRVTAEFARDQQVTQEEIIRAATGGGGNHAN